MNAERSMFRGAASGPAVLVTLVAVLAVGAGTALFLDGRSHAGQDRRAEEFQTLVGGLGFGPAVDLAHCAFTFDPRLCPGCQQAQGPIAGGVYFCPYHGCSVLFYPPLDSVRKDGQEPGSDVSP